MGREGRKEPSAGATSIKMRCGGRNRESSSERLLLGVGLYPR